MRLRSRIAPPDDGSGAADRAALFRRAAAIALALLTVLAAATRAEADAQKQVPRSRSQIELSYAPLVKQTAPAVVNIYSRRIVEQVLRSPLFDDPFFKQFFGDRLPVPRRRRMQNSLGSGVIVDPDGLIVTNHHVIAEADEITVALADRREFPAEMVLQDERTDLAVLRIDTRGETLPHLELRDSDQLEVGDLVLAIGNPFNVGQTVTSGIVSATARTGIGVGEHQYFIQTDAAINPGNSGGALVTLDGRLAGVNTAIYSRTGGSIGIGFAVPSNMVRVVVQNAREGRDYVARPWLGVATQPVTAEIAEAMGLPRPSGALISAVHPEGPARQAGLQPGDVIWSVDGLDVEDPSGLDYRLATRLLGETAELEIWREGRQPSLTVTMRPAPEVPPRDLIEIDGRNPLAGAVVGNLSPALAEEIGIDQFAEGVIIYRIRRGSPAERHRLRPGDRVLRVNGARIDSSRMLADLLDKLEGGWRIALQRGERMIEMVVRG